MQWIESFVITNNCDQLFVQCLKAIVSYLGLVVTLKVATFIELLVLRDDHYMDLLLMLLLRRLNLNEDDLHSSMRYLGLKSK